MSFIRQRRPAARHSAVNMLLNRIWGYDFEGTTRTVDTHIKTLRQKLGDEGKHIVTLIRSGYKFEVSV